MIIRGEEVLASEKLRNFLTETELVIKSITFRDGSKVDNELCKDINIENVRVFGKPIVCFTKGIWTKDIVKGMTFEIQIL